METNSIEQTTENITGFISLEDMLEHWQGHRRLSRRMIEAFPEEAFYNFSIGGMRTYAELTMEMMDLGAPAIKGIATGDWSGYGASGEVGHSVAPSTKAELLVQWDTATEQINTLWRQVQPEKFQQVEVAFGQYENTNFGTIQYVIDNEIHHRAQGYVYLRALGIEPPAFWNRN